MDASLYHLSRFEFVSFAETFFLIMKHGISRRQAQLHKYISRLSLYFGGNWSFGQRKSQRDAVSKYRNIAVFPLRYVVGKREEISFTTR